MHGHWHVVRVLESDGLYFLKEHYFTSLALGCGENPGKWRNPCECIV
ncbi:hypothetical protein DVU_2790 [Nitratidesulfovibrio vulgaris str. Hildenborough]|uniref:Uncharacterized protein n=1 Tax=Nitratidesulfovibrio vulgaris (strain ATCC 29579 / DSM 644 / CCUG 34227 / NCIMB 8303 / VKM B-1760 / Hildenborough) TaxID=882 RepID=Q727R5_NITV2|nr:hypothetical protein DVU_2790 [Nitratidesulfovibrio vulgaris str. Hildenborough]